MDKANTPKYRLAPLDGEYEAGKTAKVTVPEDGKLALHGANSSYRLLEKEL
ncbi:hypothetical protein LZ30DRAFT_786608 [Colletotrichum cereale]|nr:hypothetical protein LZ30DRAFT_786608 [Colletotrichum cereale]